MGEQILWILGVNNKLIYATAKHQDNYCVVEMRSLFAMFLLAYIQWFLWRVFKFNGIKLYSDVPLLYAYEYKLEM